MIKRIVIYVLMCVSLYAQENPWGVFKDSPPWHSGNAFNKSFEPINLPIDTTTTSVFFYGEAPKTKVAKDSGGVSVRPYMRVRADSNAVIANGNFDNSIEGWVGYGGGETLEWVASGGGFTGAMHVVITDANQQAVYYPVTNYGGTFRLRFDINVVSATDNVRFLYYDGAGVSKTIAIGGIGNYSIDTLLTFNANNEFEFNVSPTSAEFYVDNIYFSYNDSTYGYIYTLTRPSDTTTYYYSQSVSWIQKDKDTIWLAAATDTVVIPAGFDVDVSIRGEGSVTGEGKYTYGSEVTLTAIADEGYTFSNWNTDLSKTDNPLVFNMQPNDTALVARFTRNTPLADVIINNNPVDSLHEGNVSDAFIEGYECNGAIWNGTILTIEATLASCLSRNDTIGAEIVIRSTSGMSSYISTADAYYPTMLAMPAGSNTYFQVYNSGGTMPTSIIVTGAGDAANETGYDVEFFSPDPITGEPDLSSYSNGYIAGVMKYLSEELGVSVWDIRDTLQTRLGGSWTSEDGYGLVDCDLVATIMGENFSDGLYTIDGNELYTSDGNRIYAKQED